MEHVPVNTTGRAAAPQPAPKKKSKFKIGLRQVLLGLAGLVVLAAVAGAVWMGFRSSTAAAIDNGKYQAVFLTNGQVYFGKLETLNGDYLRLTEIYYLQAQSEETSEDEKTNPQKTSENAEADVQLIKLGNEVHGPQDEMIVSRDQVLFFENLKEDSRVSASIQQYRQNQNK